MNMLKLFLISNIVLALLFCFSCHLGENGMISTSPDDLDLNTPGIQKAIADIKSQVEAEIKAGNLPPRELDLNRGVGDRPILSALGPTTLMPEESVVLTAETANSEYRFIIFELYKDGLPVLDPEDTPPARKYKKDSVVQSYTYDPITVDEYGSGEYRVRCIIIKVTYDNVNNRPKYKFGIVNSNTISITFLVEATISAEAIGDYPIVAQNTYSMQNGDFYIECMLNHEPPVGEGCDDDTFWTLNFVPATDYTLFNTLTCPLTTATLTLTLTPGDYATNLTYTDNIYITGLPSFSVGAYTFVPGKTMTIIYHLLDYFTEAEILNTLAAGNGTLDFRYNNDAIISYAKLVLTKSN